MPPAKWRVLFRPDLLAATVEQQIEFVLRQLDRAKLIVAAVRTAPAKSRERLVEMFAPFADETAPKVPYLQFDHSAD